MVQGVREENGFQAWRALHQRFGPSVAAKQGRVMCDLSAMVAKPAKTTSETRALVVELERRIRLAEDVTGDVLGDGHVKSILAAVLDPVTRAHTSAYQGVGTSYQELKRVVLEFANNNLANTSSVNKPSGPDPMQIGKCTTCHVDEEEHEEEESEEVAGELSAVAAHAQCYQCGGYGHLARTCPTPKGAKGGGKGGPKGAKGGSKGEQKGGKGGGKKGPATGCWTCGGQHFAAECPFGKGGGKGSKGGKAGFNAMSQWWPELNVRSLCALKAVDALKPIVHTTNRFEALSEEESSQKVCAMPTLADFITVGSASKLSQKQMKVQAKKSRTARTRALREDPAP